MCSQNAERECFEKFICELQYISTKALNIKIFFILARLHYHPLDQKKKKYKMHKLDEHQSSNQSNKAEKSG